MQVAAPQQAPSLAELRIPEPRTIQFNGLELLGHGLTLVGQEDERESFKAGDLLHLSLFWAAIERPRADAKVDIGLQQGGAVTSLVRRTLIPQHPTSTWNPGDRYRDQYRLAIPANLRGSTEPGHPLGQRALR